MGGSPVSLDPIVIPLIEGPKILDVGCGFGKWGNLCYTNYWETRNPVGGTPPEIVGCDGYLPNVEMARRNGCYRECMHLKVPPLPFSDMSFDTVLMIEIIEHLLEFDAVELIDEAKRVARKRVVLSTPNFPDFRDGHDTITGWNELDAHLSYWSQSRLRQLDFEISGAGVKSRSRYARGVLRRFGLLPWFDARFRLALSGLGSFIPFTAENTVAVWVRR
jgi:SAM-dependent methyltransferase